jgi:hypothetical protein
MNHPGSARVFPMEDQPMTREAAKRLLDRVRDGRYYFDDATIREALIASGDLADDPPPRMSWHEHQCADVRDVEQEAA